jgi:hypothetical protein
MHEKRSRHRIASCDRTVSAARESASASAVPSTALTLSATSPRAASRLYAARRGGEANPNIPETPMFV